MNGSHTSQGGIPQGRMSQLKTEHFLFTLESAPPSTSLLHLYSFVAKRHPVLGTQFSPPRKVGHRPEGALLAPFPQHGNHGLL